MVIAPALGLAIDAVAAGGPGGMYWPIGVLGLVVSAVMLASSRSRLVGRPLDP